MIMKKLYFIEKAAKKIDPKTLLSTWASGNQYENGKIGVFITTQQKKKLKKKQRI